MGRVATLSRQGRNEKITFFSVGFGHRCRSPRHLSIPRMAIPAGSCVPVQDTTRNRVVAGVVGKRAWRDGRCSHVHNQYGFSRLAFTHNLGLVLADGYNHNSRTSQ
jgi:hypothetical protein